MNKVALVTGGTRGIGRGVCEALKAAGYTVAANYAGNDEAAAKFTEQTGIPAYKFDVGDFQACQDGIAALVADLGDVGVLINNAGITRDGTLMNMSHEDWQAVVRINLGGCFNTCKAVFAAMRDNRFGRIVNIGSINGQAGQYGQVNYAAAKSGIHGFTKALAQEGARYNITVNAIAPGFMITTQNRFLLTDEKSGELTERGETVIGQVPMARFGDPPEVVGCALWLFSEQASFVTGAIVPIDGGFSAFCGV